ncbi:hypothetical protein GCM10007071_01470 [Marinobacter zhanjiangensis]|uniref:Outer membrane lipoprotein-sorting protein n=2 Tax=Marinobacter zhanjiangensis TaxID=578215 RepID=A0ABQ3AJL2_9GAMM|nr:hypothetical protein GCM10007071_01470 [Marinobacter zhanjiangensis]
MYETMQKKLIPALCISLLALASVNTTQAAVSQAQANRLGNSLTPFGAIRAGNPEGTIPRWTGGDTTIPDGYQGNGDHHVNPYPDDKPRYVVTADNIEEYRDMLPDGVAALINRYPETFKVRVLPTRRTHTAPDHVVENTKDNATSASLVDGGNGIKNAFGGHPFPILHGTSEEKAKQAIWNHTTRWRGRYVKREFSEVVVVGGKFRPVTMRQEIFFNWNMKGGSTETLDNIANYYLSTVIAPEQYAGGGILTHDTLDQVKEPRKAWGFSAGEVRRAPSLGYDAPIASSGGLRTVDDTDIYNGAPDRFNWEYKGLEEKIIPYNNFELTSDKYTYDEVLGDQHLNPDLMRWELHRVHVVEGILREDSRHLYHKRVFYIDEDSWNIAVADQYDDKGNLWRVSTGMLKNFYDLPGVINALDVFHDLHKGLYHVSGLVNESGSARLYEDEFPGKRYFSPFTLRRRLSDN